VTGINIRFVQFEVENESTRMDKINIFMIKLT